MENLKRDLLYWSKRLYQKNMSPATSGNVSVRTDKGILISATNVCLNDMCEDDLVLIDFDGNVIEGNKKPSSEKFLHTYIYESREDIKAIMHAHCPAITGFAVANEPIQKPILPEFIFHFDKIPVAQYDLPSSIKLADKTSKLFRKYDTVLMANHGVVTGKTTIQECFYTLEALKAYAETYYAAQLAGKPKMLTRAQISDVRKLKAN